MPIHRGAVHWVELPGQIRHPHLVVQDDVFNQSRIDSVIVCALSSNLRRAREPGNVQLDPGEANLDKTSVVVVSRIESIPKTQLGPYIGTLSKARVDAVIEGLRFQQRAFLQGR